MDLPATSTPLFGRETEIAQIAQYLDDTKYRLVTLVGPGGIGKTRLGSEAARRYGDRTKDGVVFVDLQAVDTPEMVMQSLADSLRVSIQNRDTAVQQIAHFLTGKETLLFFDNFEQVVNAAPMIGQLIDISRGTTVLVTSRRPLRLVQEWLLQVDGLPVSQPNRPGSSAENAATQLFLDRALKVRPDLSPEREILAIERICRLTDGMPLAIEIAASWTHMLDCSEIANEIEQNRQFLKSSMRDVPVRHRSIQAIFDQSMRLLDQCEREAFIRLSIFRGGFTRDAAENVAHADLGVLSSLADGSLIRRTPEGRYRIHELVRQFGQDLLSESEVERAETQLAHRKFFMEFLAERHDDMSVARQVAAAAEIEVELENVNTAWRFAVENIQADEVAAAVVSMAQFIQYRGRYAVGADTFTHAVSAFENADQTRDVQRALALLNVQHAWFNLRQGRFDAAENAFCQSAALHEQLGMLPIRGFAMDPGLGLAYVASARGDLLSAKEKAETAIELAKEQSNNQHRGAASQLLGHLALREGNLEEAKDRLNASLAISAEMGEKWFTAYCHSDLGEVAATLGEYDKAEEHFLASLEIGRDFGDRGGIGLSLVHLAEVASLQGHTEEARNYFEDSKSAYIQVGDRGGMARVDCGLGVLAVSTGDTVDAGKRLREVLETSQDMQFVAIVLDVLSGIGELAIKAGMGAEGERLLSFVDAHGSTESRTRTRLRTTLNIIGSPHRLDEVLDDHVVLAREILDTLERASVAATTPSTTQTGTMQGNQRLPDPLTDRELEILSLIAQGFPNQQIADDLIVSLGTVKWHSNQIYTKLGVHNRTSAVAKARDLSILTGSIRTQGTAE